MPESPRISVRIDEEDLLSLLLILEEARKKDQNITLSTLVQAAVRHFINSWHMKTALERRCGGL